MVGCVWSSEAPPHPATDARHVAAGSGSCVLHSVWLEVLERRLLRENEQARRRRKGRALRFLGKSRNAERTADPHRPPEYLGGKLDQPVELASAAGQNHAPAWLGRKWRRLEAIADHLQDFLHPRPHDPHQLGTRHQLRALTPVIVDRTYGEHVPLVLTTRKNA